MSQVPLVGVPGVRPGDLWITQAKARYYHYRANLENISQSGPDSGLGLSTCQCESFLNQLSCSLPARPHESIHDKRFISQSLDYAEKNAKSVRNYPLSGQLRDQLLTFGVFPWQ